MAGNNGKESCVEYAVFQEYYSKLTNIISVTGISEHLVSANIITPGEDEEITSPSTSKEKAKALLQKLSGPIAVGSVETFSQLLDVMEKFANNDSKKLACEIKRSIEIKKKIITNPGGSLNSELAIENFLNYQDPQLAFQKLSSHMEEYFSLVRFTKIRRACLQYTSSPGDSKFSESFTEAIFESEDLEELLDAFTTHNYWNWIDVRIMEAIVACLSNQAAERTLESYKQYLSALELKKVLPTIPVFVDSNEYRTIEEKFKFDDEGTLTVGHILKRRYDFSYELCELSSRIPKLCSIKTGCLQLLWSIPRRCVSHAYKSALVNFHKIENILFLNIDYYPTLYSKCLLSKDTFPVSRLASRKRSSASFDQSIHSNKYFKPSTVADEFSYVTDQITKLLHSCDPKLLIERCDAIMASAVHGVKLFSDDQLEQLDEYSSTPSLLQGLSHLWSWNNHSVLRALVGACDEAVKLLDDFDCHLDHFESITSYPTSEVAPTHATTQTVLEVKCNKDAGRFTLQNTTTMCSLIVKKCEITHHCPQLLATLPGSVRLHWSIPSCIAHLISSKVLQCSNYLYKKGVIEVAVYPNVQVVTRKFADDAVISENQDLSKQLHYIHRKYDSIVEENKRLKQYESDLQKSVETLKLKCKELEDKYNKGLDEVEKKMKEKITNQLSNCKKLKEKVIQTFDEDVDFPIKTEMRVKTQEVFRSNATEENWLQLEYEFDDMQKLIEDLIDKKSKVRQTQHQQEMKISENKESFEKNKDGVDKDEIVISENQDLSKQLQHIHRKYDSIVEENKTLRQYESDLQKSVEILKLKCKELEDKYDKVLDEVERKMDEKIANQRSNYKKLKEKLIQTFDRDVNLPVKTDKTHEETIKGTTAENWQQLEYELDDMQTQHQEEIDQLNSLLVVKEKENVSLKEDKRLLLKKISESKEPYKKSEAGIDKVYPVQYGLLGNGNYGEVYKIHHKDKFYAGKVLYSNLLPGHPKCDMNKLLEQFTLKCATARKFSHHNVEWFVEIACLKENGLPVIISELLSENLTVYVGRTRDILHFDLQLSICQDMAWGIEYLHSQQMVHGNLHGANVLVTHDHHAKIADYLCPVLLNNVALDNALDFLPPETIQNKRTTVQSNVFTLAVLFLEVITKHSPQPSDDYTSISEWERRSNDVKDVPKCHPLLPLMQHCLNNHELARPLANQVCDQLAQLIKDKNSPQRMAFRLIHTSEYPPLLPALASGKHQLDYTLCQKLPVPMYWAYAVTIGTMVYVTGGNSRNGDAVEHIYKFDLENNTWDKLPPSKYHHCVPVVLDGKLSLIGGRVPGNKIPISKVNTFNEDSSTWVTVYPDMNQPRHRPAVVTTDHFVVVLGGKFKTRSKPTDSIEILNIPNKHWITLATRLPDKMYDMSTTISNDLVWIIGYDNGSNRYNKVFTLSVSDLIVHNTVKHLWKTMRYDTVCYKTASIHHSDPLVILGGDDRQNKTVSAVVAFDTQTESWSEVATLSSPRAHCAVAKLPGERGIIVLGGSSDARNVSLCNSTCLNTAEIYYININKN